MSPWGLDKATLSLGAAKVCKLVLAEMVRDDVEENLLLEPKSNPARSRPRAPLGNRQQTRLAADAQRQAFHPAVAQRTSLRIATRAEFFRELSVCSCKRWLRSPGQKSPSASESLRRKNSAYVPFLREATYALETFTR